MYFLVANNLFFFSLLKWLFLNIIIICLSVRTGVTVVSGPIWTNFGLNKMSNVFLQNGFYALLDAFTGKLLTYDVFCTPKAAVLHAFINLIFCQTGVKSHHPMGIKTSDGGNFFLVGLHEK